MITKDSMFLYPITKFELSKEISKLPTHKAPGYDQITSKVINNLLQIIRIMYILPQEMIVCSRNFLTH